MTAIIVIACLCLILTGHPFLALGLVFAVGLGILVHGVITAELHPEWDDELQAARRKRGLQ